MKIGTVTGPLLNGIAGQLEALGYDAVLFADSQNRAPEVWTALGAASCETSRALIGTGVTNTVTRDPAVLASAATALQLLSEGRAVLAIGRGDSAAHFIGRKPERVADFEAKLNVLRQYLREGRAQRGDLESPMEWTALAADYGPVPIELVPSGPRMTALAARLADRISFAVGADPEYISTFLEHARAEIAAAGRDPDSVKFGAWVNVVLNDDRATALDAVRGTTGIWARFSLMRPDRDALPGPLQRALGMLERYDMNSFGTGSATDQASMPDEFVDWFAVAGNADHVRRRLDAIADLGLDYCYVVPGELGFADAVGEESIRRVATEIAPLLR